MKKHLNNGFTLIEILIALFIFAILGTIAAVGLRAVVTSHQHILATQHKLEQMQYAFLIMRHDFTQLIDRPITDTTGDELPALIIQDNGQIEFTTGGFVNPYAQSQRSTLIRVGYKLENDNLVRLSWSALDRPANINPQQQILLRHITKMTFSYVDDKGRLLNVWQQNKNTPFTLPQAIIVNLTLANEGEWQGVFPIVGRGYD